MAKMKFGRYDHGAFLTFVCYAACSMVVPVSLVQIAQTLNFPLGEGGMSAGGGLHMGRSIALMASMALCGFTSGRWGNCKSIGFALLFMVAGMLIGAFSPFYGVLFLALLIAGFGEGFVEGLATPLVQDLHKDDQPGRYINFSHGFWSVGVVAVVLLAGYLLLIGVSWRWIMAGVGIFTIVPALILLLPSRKYDLHPDANNRQDWKKVCANARDIVRLPHFWLFFVIMFVSGGGEFSLTFWLAAYIQEVRQLSPMSGGLVTACFAAGMIMGRTGWGMLLHQRHLGMLVIVSAVVGTVVTCIFPLIDTMWILYVVLFIAGVASGPFWPSVQSYCSERIPQVDTTMLFILLSCAGIPGAGVFAWLMGIVGDRFGLEKSVYLVPLCYTILGILMLGDYICARRTKKVVMS